MSDAFADKPYVPWLEGVIRDLVDIDPECVALQMRGRDGGVYTCYWNVSSDDRSIMIDAMRDDDRLEWIRANRDLILDVLSEEVDGDGLQQSDTEADSEG